MVGDLTAEERYKHISRKSKCKHAYVQEIYASKIDNHAMLFSSNRFSFLFPLILRYAKTQPSIAKKNNPFCSSDQLSLATTSLTGLTIVGMVRHDRKLSLLALARLELRDAV
jgi:hypothetical protein